MQPKPTAPTTQNLSTRQTSISPASDELVVYAKEPNTASNLAASTPVEPGAPSTTPSVGAPELIVTAFHTQDQAKESPPMPERNSQVVDTIGTPPPSPHADIVAQLEAWLRAIESRRQDRQTDVD